MFFSSSLPDDFSSSSKLIVELSLCYCLCRRLPLRHLLRTAYYYYYYYTTTTTTITVTIMLLCYHYYYLTVTYHWKLIFPARGLCTIMSLLARWWYRCAWEKRKYNWTPCLASDQERYATSVTVVSNSWTKSFFCMTPPLYTIVLHETHVHSTHTHTHTPASRTVRLDRMQNLEAYEINVRRTSGLI